MGVISYPYLISVNLFLQQRASSDSCLIVNCIGNILSMDSSMNDIMIIIKPICMFYTDYTMSFGTSHRTWSLDQVGSNSNWQSVDKCQRILLKWVFDFVPHLLKEHTDLIHSNRPRESAICPRRSLWASCKIRKIVTKIVGCACAGNAGNLSRATAS